jgi:hypothetical protein
MEQKMKKTHELEDVIARAIKKVHARKENDLCRYIPVSTGGYMHHFTLRKMKRRNPDELGSLIEKFIIQAVKPTTLPPKQRAPRGSRKRPDQLTFSRSQLERMLNIARQAGDREMVAMLAPKKSLTTSKRDLIASIRHNRIEPSLWDAYVESLAAAQGPALSPMQEVLASLR